VLAGAEDRLKLLQANMMAGRPNHHDRRANFGIRGARVEVAYARRKAMGEALSGSSSRHRLVRDSGDPLIEFLTFLFGPGWLSRRSLGAN